MEEPKKPAADPQRRADLAKIHLAVKQLGLKDEEYRALLHAVGKVSSAKDLDWMGRQQLLIKLQGMGFKPQAAPGKGGRKAWRPSAGSQQAKILALWLTLKRRGKLETPTDQALFAWVERMTGVEHPDWLTADQANVAIEGLKAWLDR